MSRAGIAVLVVLVSGGPGAARGQDATGQSPANLAGRLEGVMSSPGFEHAHWGLLVVDAKSGKPVYERNPDLLFAPASVTKLFTTAATLVEFGADHRFHTPLVRKGSVDAAGRLHGDLILIASGDLCMGGRTGLDGSIAFEDDDHTYAGGNLYSKITAPDPLAGLDHLAREVHAAGIRAISGDVIIDDRLFDAAPTTGSGPRFVSPIMINDNVIDVIARPAAKAGEPALVEIRPATSHVAMDAQVETVPAESRPALVVAAVGPRRFIVRGRLPVGFHPVVKVHEIDDPSSFARALLIEALGRRGVKVGTSPLAMNSRLSLPDRAETAKLPKVAEYISPPFSENLRLILKVSHNLHASTLPLLLAARYGERTLNQGLRREGAILSKLGIAPGTASFAGGAGGARADMATPRATVTLLRAMAARPEASVYETALPILGRDGTLAKAVPSDSPARGHAHAKTGTYFVENELDGKVLLTSKALAGYLETASGRDLVIAAFINDVELDAPTPGQSVSQATQAAGRLLGRICEVLYDDVARPATASPAPSSNKPAESTGR